MFGAVRSRPIGGHLANHLCGCYFLIPSQPNPEYLPLVGSEAHTTILSTSSSTVLKQTYSNTSSRNIEECIYTFPLYDGVGVVGFTCKIGSKTLTGLVKEKLEAKKIFDDAVAKGQTAGLLQQVPQAADVWSTKLGNIPTGQTIIVEITYIGELKHTESDGIRFTIPTRIAPRYGSGPAASYTTKAEEIGGIKFTVDVNMPNGSIVRSIESPSHQIKVSMGTISTTTEADPIFSKASATLSLESAALEKDFVLIIQSKDVGIPKAFLETHTDYPNHRALMATLVPKFSIPPIRPEIVFVADRSGSMRGNISMLVSAMKVFLKSMPQGVKFNICSFGSNHEFLWPKSASYTSESLDLAMGHLNTFSSNMGGTETHGAIKATIDRRFTDIPLEVIVLTDGDIWNQESLFTYINDQVVSSKGNIRVFTLGIGNNVSSALIEGLARAGNGFAQSVQDGERLDSSVVRMLRASLSPHVSNYTLEVKYEPGDDDFEVIEKVTDSLKVLLNAKTAAAEPASISLFDSSVDEKQLNVELRDATSSLPNVPYPKLLQAPHNIPSLFAFSRTTVYLLMSAETFQKNPKSIVLRGTTTEGTVLAIEIAVEVLPMRGKTIHQLAAKRAVQELEEGRGWLFDAKDEVDGILIKDRFPSAFEDLVKKEAIRLGEKFQVAGKWCSFVAVAANDDPIASQNRTHQANPDDEFEIIETPTSDTSPDLRTAQYRPPIRLLGSPTNPMMRMTGAVKQFGGGGPKPPAPATGLFGAANPQISSSSSAQSSSGGLFGSTADHTSSDSPTQGGSLFSSLQPTVTAPIRSQSLSRGINQSPGFSPVCNMIQSPGGVETDGTKQALPPQNFSGSSLRSVSNLQSSKAKKLKGSGEFVPVVAASNNHPAEISWASKSTAEKVVAVIELQQFDGSWKTSQELNAILALNDSSGATTEWMTMFVVRWLEIKCASEEAIFEMVVEKAREWLAANVSGLEDLEKEVSVTVKSA